MDIRIKQGLKKGTWVQRVCQICGKIFYTRKCWLRNGKGGKYCSKECQLKAVHSIPRDKKIEKICIVCNKKYKVKKYRAKNSKFCSKECYEKGRHLIMPKGEKHPNWKGGISNRPFLIKKIHKKLKKAIGRCQICGRIDNLHVHHIEKWSENLEKRYDESNLIVVCSNCHAKLHAGESVENMLNVPVKRNGAYLKCQNCGKEYYVSPYKIKISKYCSRQCKNEALRKK